MKRKKSDIKFFDTEEEAIASLPDSKLKKMTPIEIAASILKTHNLDDVEACLTEEILNNFYVGMSKMNKTPQDNPLAFVASSISTLAEIMFRARQANDWKYELYIEKQLSKILNLADMSTCQSMLQGVRD